MDNNKLTVKLLQARREAFDRLLLSENIINSCSEIVDIIIDCFMAGGKLLFCGNGGSAADAQHLAAEFSGRFYLDRRPLYAEALHVNSSYLTAVANDMSFSEVYSRLVEGTGRKGDILIALSTSGNSVNIIKAAEAAARYGLTTIGLTGEDGGKLKEVVMIPLQVPSDDTPVIQEMHIMLGHIICQMVESIMFGND